MYTLDMYKLDMYTLDMYKLDMYKLDMYTLDMYTLDMYTLDMYTLDMYTLDSAIKNKILSVYSSHIVCQSQARIWIAIGIFRSLVLSMYNYVVMSVEVCLLFWWRVF
jgi:hypothetical protein